MNEAAVIGELYRIVNKCNAREVPMGALYSELDYMLEHGVDAEKVDAIVAQVAGHTMDRKLRHIKRVFKK
jgi:hypothetical protein